MSFVQAPHHISSGWSLSQYEPNVPSLLRKAVQDLPRLCNDGDVFNARHAAGLLETMHANETTGFRHRHHHYTGRRARFVRHLHNVTYSISNDYLVIIRSDAIVVSLAAHPADRPCGNLQNSGP